MVLATKELSYRDIEITPAFNQIGERRRYSQKGVQVIENGTKFLNEFSQTISYQENKTNRQQLLPKNPQEERQASPIESAAYISLTKRRHHQWLAEIHHYQTSKQS